ncbi:MAG: cupin domain-containing protein [Myxococcota bacterium]
MALVHEEDVAWVESKQGSVFENRRRRLGRAAGSEELGCCLTEVPPGKTAWPFQAHLGNEEAIYVLRGRATLRLGDARHALKPGDYVALRASAEAAHQVINTGDETFAYLAMSTMNPTDVVLYPDSGKRGVFAGGAPGAASRTLTAFTPEEADVEYWEGEPVGPDPDAPAAAAAEAAIEQQVDDELEAMKRRLSLEGDGD